MVHDPQSTLRGSVLLEKGLSENLQAALQAKQQEHYRQEFSKMEELDRARERAKAACVWPQTLNLGLCKYPLLLSSELRFLLRGSLLLRRAKLLCSHIAVRIFRNSDCVHRWCSRCELEITRVLRELTLLRVGEHPYQMSNPMHPREYLEWWTVEQRIKDGVRLVYLVRSDGKTFDAFGVEVQRQGRKIPSNTPWESSKPRKWVHSPAPGPQSSRPKDKIK